VETTFTVHSESTFEKDNSYNRFTVYFTSGVARDYRCVVEEVLREVVRTLSDMSVKYKRDVAIIARFMQKWASFCPQEKRATKMYPFCSSYRNCSNVRLPWLDV